MWSFAVVAAVLALAGFDAGSPIVSLPALVVLLVIAVELTELRRHRRRARGGLVVPLFSTSGNGAHQDEVQRVILTSLRDKLTPEEARLVHAVPIVIGPDDKDFAIELRKRLRARFLLHGRIAEHPDGSYSVYARLAQPIEPGVVHLDLVTRDVTFAKGSWRNLVNRLTPALDVIDEEYPLEFATELEAVVRGTAGQLAEDRNDPVRAESLLRAALGVAPTSRSHQIDLLRAALARAVFDQGREKEAIRSLERTSRESDPAPELLRTLERLLFLQGGDRRTPVSRRKGERALRAAAAQRSDPQRALTIYNLAMLIDDAEESAALMDELLRSKTHYRDAWYLRRQRGALYWAEAVEVHEGRGLEAARQTYAKAASMYSSAIRRRPKFKLVVTRTTRRLYWYRTPPLLYANAADAHRWAGHRARAWWYSRKAERRRAKWLARGHRALKRQRWSKAVYYLDHVAMVRGDSETVLALTWQAIAVRQLGEAALAEELWQKALSMDAVALSWRALVVLDHSYGLMEQDLPGIEPTSVEQVNALIEQRARAAR